MENTVHFVLQAKGGVGKSFVAVNIAQYIDDKFPGTLVGFDTDQENTTFKHYKAFDVTHINISNPDRSFNDKHFDKLIESTFATNGNVVIDTGSNTFSAMISYMLSNGVMDILQEMGKKVYIHTIVAGGAELHDTTAGFKDMAEQLNAQFVIWLNEHFGSTADFHNSEAFSEYCDNVRGLVLLPSRKSDTFGDDIRRMSTARLTAKEVNDSDKFTFMEKNRIKMVMSDIFSKLDKVEW